MPTPSPCGDGQGELFPTNTIATAALYAEHLRRRILQLERLDPSATRRAQLLAELALVHQMVVMIEREDEVRARFLERVPPRRLPEPAPHRAGPPATTPTVFWSTPGARWSRSRERRVTAPP